MKYYKLTDPANKSFIDWRQYPYYGYMKEDTIYPNNPNTCKEFIVVWPEHLAEISKKEYLLHKIKQLRTLILDKQNGFLVHKKYCKLFLSIIEKEGFTSNITSLHNFSDYYFEQHSKFQNVDYRALIDDEFIKQYNLNLIVFKDLIDEIKDINNEI